MSAGSVSATAFAQKSITLADSPINVTIAAGDNETNADKLMLTRAADGTSTVYAGEADSDHAQAFAPANGYVKAIVLKITLATNNVDYVYTDGNYKLELSAVASPSGVLKVRLDNALQTGDYVGTSKVIHIPFTIADGACNTSVWCYMSLTGTDGVNETSLAVGDASFSISIVDAKTTGAADALATDPQAQ